MEDLELEELNNWNPMEEHYRDKRANSYREGIGQDLQSRDISDVKSSTGLGGHKPVVLYIINVPLEMDEIALQNIFEQEGKVAAVHIPVPSPEKVAQYRSKIGFVTMENLRGAQAAIEHLNGFMVKGKGLVVKVKQSKEEMLRRKEYREREENFLQSIGHGRDNRTDAGVGNGISPSFGESGEGESQREARRLGPSGDAASRSKQSVTVSQDSRRVQEHGGKRALLPSPSQREVASAPSVADSVTGGRGPGQSSTARVRRHYTPSIAGSDVGTDLCASCQRTASMRCRACRKVYYCNANCQGAHWPIHRKACTYDTRVPATPSIPAPDFDEMDVDVTDDYIAENREYLMKEWVSKLGTMSDSSSSSEDRRMNPKLQYKAPSKPNTRPGPGNNQMGQQRSQQRNAYPPQEAVTSPQDKGPRPGPPQQRPAGPQGGGYGPRDRPEAGPRDRPETGPRDRPETGPRDRPETGPRARPDTPMRDGQGRQQGRKGAPENTQAARAGPMQGDGPKQFAPQSGPQDRRGNQSTSYPNNGKGNQPRNGPQEGRGNQLRNGPEEGDSQFRNGLQGEKTSQLRTGPQQGKWGPGDRGDKSHLQRGDNLRAQQNRGGPEQGGSSPRKADGARGPPFNRQNRPEQLSSQRDGNRGGPRNDRGPGRQQADRGKYREGRDQKFNNSGGAEEDNWDEEKVKSATNSTPSAPSAKPSGGSPSVPSSGSQNSQAVVPVPCMGKPMDVVPLNTAVMVVVSYVESPQRFWVQMTEQLTSFVPFVEQAFAKYTGRDRSATVAEVGQLFVCEFMGELARAKVVSIAGTKVKIFYMDYGNSEEVQMSQLLPVPGELASLPQLSLLCTLMVRPSDGGKWPKDVVTLFQEVFDGSGLCTLTVFKKQPAVCEVALVRRSDGLDAATFLKEKGFGADCTEVTSPVAPSASLAVPSRVMAMDISSVSDRLGKGERVRVVLLDFSDPMHTIVHIAAMEDAFNLFSANMVTHYNNQPPIPYQPVVGEMVVGRFSMDSCWYRAEVLEVFCELKEAFLSYVDFGNKEQLPFTEIRALEEEFATTPIHGVCCALGGISASVGGQWQEEQLTVFVSCMARYLQQEGDMPTCTLLVDSIRDGKVWMDIVGEDLHSSLCQDLLPVLEGASSPTPVHTPDDAVPAQATVPVPDEKPAPRQPSPMAASSSSPVQLERVTLPVGEYLEVGIQDIESCHKFFVNGKKGEEDLTLLRERLTALCEGEEPGRPPLCQSVFAGDLVLVNFTLDDQWYRGQVERVSDDGTTCTVFFLDYGNKEEKSVASLRVTPPQFLKLPAQAIRCCLAGVPCPAPEDVESRFFNLCLQTEAMVKVVEREGDSHTVDIIADNTSVVTVLGLLSPTPPSQSVDVEDSLEKLPSPTQCPLLEGGDDDDSPPKALSPCPPSPEGNESQGMPSSPQPGEEAEGSVQGSPQGASTHPPQAASPHPSQGEGASPLPPQAASPQPPPATEDRCEEPALTWDCLPVVGEEDGSVVDTLMTYMVSPANFFASHLSHYVAQYETGGLVAQLQEVNVTASALDCLPAVGELLCGLFEGEWYRCKVLDIVDQQVHVVFFDFGNEALLELSSLHPLSRQLCTDFPLATFRCCLDGVSPASGEGWDEDSVQEARELMENQKLRLEVKGVTGEGVHRVKVAIMSLQGDTEPMEDLAQLLIQSGKAKSSTDPLKELDPQKEELQRKVAELQAKLASMDGLCG